MCVCHATYVYFLAALHADEMEGLNDSVPVELLFGVSSKAFVAVTSYEVPGTRYRICFGLL